MHRQFGRLITVMAASRDRLTLDEGRVILDRALDVVMRSGLDDDERHILLLYVANEWERAMKAPR